MTIKELYEWAKENGVEDYDITLDDRYDPFPTCVRVWEPQINEKDKEIIM